MLHNFGELSLGNGGERLIGGIFPRHTLAGYNQALPGSGSDLSLVTAGAGATTQDNHDGNIILGKSHQFEIPPLIRHLLQVISYPEQVHLWITGTTVFQSYPELDIPQ